MKCREERLKVAEKDRVDQIRQASLESKLERLIETAKTLLNIEEEGYEAETRIDDWKRPTPCPQKRQIRSLQDVGDMPSMYDEQEFESKNKLADYFEEQLVESPQDLIGDNAYNYDFSNINLSDDNSSQRKIELARPSSVDLWEGD